MNFYDNLYDEELSAHKRVSYVIIFTLVHKRAVQSTLVTDFNQLRINFNSYKYSNQQVSLRVIIYLWLVWAVGQGGLNTSSTKLDHWAIYLLFGGGHGKKADR